MKTRKEVLGCIEAKALASHTVNETASYELHKNTLLDSRHFDRLLSSEPINSMKDEVFRCPSKLSGASAVSFVKKCEVPDFLNHPFDLISQSSRHAQQDFQHFDKPLGLCIIIALDAGIQVSYRDRSDDFVGSPPQGDKMVELELYDAVYLQGSLDSLSIFSNETSTSKCFLALSFVPVFIKTKLETLGLYQDERQAALGARMRTHLGEDRRFPLNYPKSQKRKN